MSNEGDCRTAPATPGLLIISPCSDGNLPKSMSTRAPWAWHQQGEGVFSKTAALVPYLVLRLPCPVLNSQRGKLATCAAASSVQGPVIARALRARALKARALKARAPRAKALRARALRARAMRGDNWRSRHDTMLHLFHRQCQCISLLERSDRRACFGRRGTWLSRSLGQIPESTYLHLAFLGEGQLVYLPG